MTRPDEVIYLFSDITETFNTHQALDRSEKILRNIYDNLPAGIELYDKNGFLIDRIPKIWKFSESLTKRRY